jgi:hypothetical protein
VWDVHAKHSYDISATHAEGTKPVKAAVDAVEAFVPEISLPPGRELSIGGYFRVLDAVSENALVGIWVAHHHRNRADGTVIPSALRNPDDHRFLNDNVLIIRYPDEEANRREYEAVNRRTRGRQVKRGANFGPLAAENRRTISRKPGVHAARLVACLVA